MGALKNARHEVFAQQLVQAQKFGWTRGAAYSRAGYRAEGMAAEVNASRLLKNAKNGIATRVQGIVEAGAKRAEVTVASLLGELDDVIAGAVNDHQYGAARAAIDSKARLKGLFVNKIEVGAPGSFGELTVGEVLNMVARELGVATAMGFSWLLEHDGPELAIDSIARLALTNMTLDEALTRHDQIRTALLKVASDDAIMVGADPADSRACRKQL